MTKKMTDVSKEELFEMVQAGMPVANAAEEVGITTTHAYSLLRRAGIHLNRGERIKDRFTEEERQEIKEQYYTLHMRVIDICRRWGFGSEAPFYSFLRQMDWPPRTHLKEVVEGKVAAMEQAVQMYKDGVKLWKIVHETGVQQPKLHHQIHIRGIPLRQPKKGKGES